MTTKFRQKITQNCTNLNSVQVIEEFFTCIVGFMGFVNSNLLPEFSRIPRELPWQPNMGKFKPQLH